MRVRKRIIRKPMHRKPFMLLAFPERKVITLTDAIWLEIERSSDEAIGELHKPLQQWFRLGTLIRKEQPILGGILQTLSLGAALKLAK